MSASVVEPTQELGCITPANGTPKKLNVDHLKLAILFIRGFGDWLTIHFSNRSTQHCEFRLRS
jgi:hypothetical protein